MYVCVCVCVCVFLRVDPEQWRGVYEFIFLKKQSFLADHMLVSSSIPGSKRHLGAPSPCHNDRVPYFHTETTNKFEPALFLMYWTCLLDENRNSLCGPLCLTKFLKIWPCEATLVLRVMSPIHESCLLYMSHVSYT